MNQERLTPYAALALRVSLGAMFAAHGLMKLFVFTLPGTVQFFASQGFPGWSAYPVTFAEIIGGALLLAGIGSRYVAAALIPTLLGAVLVHSGNGWVFSAPNGGWEYPVFLTVVSIVVAMLGDGAFALSRIGRQPRLVPSAA